MSRLAGHDSPDRALSSVERADRAALLPTLAVWTRYLDAMGAVADVEEAIAQWRPVLLRTKTTSALGYSPAAVSPRLTLYWARAAGQAGQAGTGTPLTLDALISALDFMRAPQATTFVPAGPGPKRVRRDGWWRLSAEHVIRLRQCFYVPVLTAPPGPPRRALPPLPTPSWSRRPILVGPSRRPDALGEATISVLRDYLRSTERTALLATALAQHRPLVTRRPGRPSATGASSGIKRDSLLVHVDALALHAATAADRLGLAVVPTLADLRGQVEVMASRATPMVRFPASFSTFDAGQVRKVAGWFEVAVAVLGIALTEAADVDADLRLWRYQQEGRHERVIATAVEQVAAGQQVGEYPPIPDGRRPEDMTVDERDYYGCLLPEDM